MTTKDVNDIASQKNLLKSIRSNVKMTEKTSTLTGTETVMVISPDGLIMSLEEYLEYKRGL